MRFLVRKTGLDSSMYPIERGSKVNIAVVPRIAARGQAVGGSRLEKSPAVVATRGQLVDKRDRASAHFEARVSGTPPVA